MIGLKSLEDRIRREQRLLGYACPVAWALTFLLPAGLAISLGRYRAAGVVFFSSFLMGAMMFAVPWIMAVQTSVEEWAKERRFSIYLPAYGGASLLLFNFFCVGMVVSALPQRPWDRGSMVIVQNEHGQLEALIGEKRWNYRDTLLAEYPMRVRTEFGGVSFTVRGEEILVYGVIHQAGLALPTSKEELVQLYRQVGDEEAVECEFYEEIGRMAVKFLESRPAVERAVLKKLQLEWDVPFDSTFSGTGVQLLQRTVTVEIRGVHRVVATPPPPPPNLPTERVVRVSEIQGA